MRASGYYASCARCGWWSGFHGRRGSAIQDELDHIRAVHLGECVCPTIQGLTTHLTGCSYFQRTPSAATAE